MCRAFVFEDVPSNRHALVSCDLAAISMLLQREVSERVADLVHPSRLMISATHTHAGPAHYFESPGYSGAFSTRLPGFDPAVVDFLADRIARAVKQATTTSARAELRWSHGEVWGLTRNRSLNAFLANSPRLDTGAPPDPALTPSQRAIDPGLDVLEIRRPGTHAPIATLAFFAMHPTVLPADSRFLGADTHGVATRIVQREIVQREIVQREASHATSSSQADKGPTAPAELRQAPAKPVVAIFNTNEGDVSPVWTEGTALEAIRLGKRLASEVVRLTARSDPWLDKVVLDSRYLEVRLPRAKFSRGRLCPRAVLGQASGRGASDHRASTAHVTDDVPDAIETPQSDPVLECQRPKAPLLGPLQPLVASKQGFPERVPLALLHLGDHYLAFVPAEMTVTAGTRLRRAIERQTGGASHGRALIAGLSNAYIQYIATPDEYQLQYYEGASTLYGQNTLPYLVERFRWLAEALERGDYPEGWKLGELDEFEYIDAPHVARLATSQDPDAPEFPGNDYPTSVCRLETFEPPALCFQWVDAAPGRAPTTTAPWVRLRRADQRVVASCWTPVDATKPPVCDPRFPIDDLGFDFTTWANEPRDDGYAWAALLRPSRPEWDEIRALEGLQLWAGAVHSQPFAPSTVSACTGEALRQCLRGAL
jgi:neutral ceramidase